MRVHALVAVGLSNLSGLVAAALSGSTFSSQHHLKEPGLSVPDETSPPWRDELLALHRSLVEIPSITGHETRVGRFIVEYLAQHGFKTRLQFLPPTFEGDDEGRFNVLAWPGESPDPRPRLVVTTHMDVVPPYIPYSISDDIPSSATRIGGRGTVDAKGSMAAQITALLGLVEESRIDKDDVMFVFVVGEEGRADGMKFFSKAMRELDPPVVFESVIFGEPTENKLACGHKGGMFCLIEATGIAGHSGYPWLGKSANALLVTALTNIIETDLGSSEEFGNTTFNIGRLTGGVAVNVIAESARADVSIRVAIGPGDEGVAIVRERVEARLREVDADAFSLECLGAFGIVRCECDVPGFEKITVNYGTDIPNLEGDHRRFLYGPGSILVAHAKNENLTVHDLETAVVGYRKLILHALGE